MGISGLMKLLSDHVPNCVKQDALKNYFGRKVAVDASISIYQFLVVVGRVGEQTLTDSTGEVTSHLQGMFYRTGKMLEAGMRPVYVFEGEPPELKRQQLAQRHGRREEALAGLEAAKVAESAEAIEKYSKRTVRVTEKHNEECKRLLRLMGVPVIDAPGEAEAQCSSMAREGLVYGVATEDMDALTFGTPRLMRHMVAPGQAAQPILEIDRAVALEGLGLTEEQFIDMCILCGCDYCPSIRGIGPVRALNLVRQHGSIDAILQHLDPAKYPRPDPYPYAEARQLFKAPLVMTAAELPAPQWQPPDEEGLVSFLCGEKQFSEERVRNAVKRIREAKGKSSQGRLEAFFGPASKVSSSTKPSASGAPATPPAAGGKRKTPAASSGTGSAKKSKGVGIGNVSGGGKPGGGGAKGGKGKGMAK